MLELINKKTAMRLLEAALPTIIDEDSGEYVLGINTAYGLIASIPPMPAEKVKEMVLGKRIACMSIEQIENVFNLIEEERNAEGIYNALKRRSV